MMVIIYDEEYGNDADCNNDEKDEENYTEGYAYFIYLIL